MKKKNRYKVIMIALLSIFTILLVSCDDFLDVRSENEVKEEDQYAAYKGFRDALTGCYMQMANKSIYGKNLTMTDIEYMACLWYSPAALSGNRDLTYQLNRHDYVSDLALADIDGMYQNLMNTVLQANIIAKHCDEDGDVVTDKVSLACVKAEALAIRAYCQLDILRLFGQCPTGGTKTVKLPYSYTTNIDEMPSYYDFTAYCNLIEQDINTALELLRNNDPVCTYGFETLNDASGTLLNDTYLYYRQSRLNYYAVLALKARYQLYAGKTSEAHATALELINSHAASLSGNTDYADSRFGLPSECLFYLSKFDVNDYANDILVGGRNVGNCNIYNDCLTDQMRTQMYASIDALTASHNRYNNLWAPNIHNTYTGGTVYTLKKYWFDTDVVSSDLNTKSKIIPMLRLSETYLIAIETATSLAEANQLYATYMYGCGISNAICPQFESLDDMKTEMVNEYRREFIGEGQMFFTYKRLGETDILWSNDTRQLSADELFVINLPSTEYDPSL